MCSTTASPRYFKSQRFLAALAGELLAIPRTARALSSFKRVVCGNCDVRFC
jgi:hypothetical protein